MDIPALKQQPQINSFANLMRGVTGAIDNVRAPVQNTLFNLLSGAYTDRLLNKMGMEQPTINQLRQEMNSPEVQMAMNIMPIGMIAYHGSPHTFDKFSLDKIGTGEGAQAYGHGLYLAESPEVANAYRSNLTYKAGEIPKVGQMEIGDFYNKVMDKANRLPPQQAAKEYDKLAMLEDLMGEQTTPQMVLANAAQREYPTHAVDWFQKEVVPNYNMPGAMYKTDIPDEAVARFLDWDKPLSQQAPEVQAALSVIRHPDGTIEGMKPHRTGEQLYSTVAMDSVGLNGKGADHNAYAAKVMQELGIPGIRYLDGGSRGAGSGTSNYVVFSPEMIRILERNGIPTGQQPWQPGEWK